MEISTLQERIVALIAQVQADSGLECPPLTEDTKPVEVVPKFDSKVWPVATTILASELGVLIPNDVNIFIDATTKRPRSIAQIAAFVSILINKEAGTHRATA